MTQLEMNGLGLLGERSRGGMLRSPMHAEVARQLGSADLRSAAHQNWFFAYRAQFTAVAANGGTQTRSIRVDGSVGFLVDQFQGSFRVSTQTGGGSLVGTPFVREQREMGDGEHDFAGFMDLIDVRMTQTDRPWFDDPLPASLILGDAVNPYYVPFKPYVPPNETIDIEVINNNTIPFSGVIALVGFKLRVARTAGR